MSNKTTDEVISLLEEKIPRDCVTSRDGGGGRKLDYLETWYVIDRLNFVFGNLGWDSETIEMEEIPNQDKPTYRAKVRVTALIQVAPGQFLNVYKEGWGYGRDKSALNPHEMASKEAESDAFKRAAMKFGKSMGLSLYDKSGDGIEEENKSVPVHTQKAPQPNRVGGVPSQPAPAVPRAPGPQTRDAVNGLISATSKVILDKKLKALPDLEALLAAFGVSRKEELTDEQASKLLTQLKEILK